MNKKNKNYKNIELSFSKSFKKYRNSNIIQKIVADEVIANNRFLGKNIIDIGAGDGELFRKINWNFDNFIAFDISKKMLSLHPILANRKIGNFDNLEIWDFIKKSNINLLLSSSAFQWSQNLQNIFLRLNQLNINYSISIFTNNTFKELHSYFNLISPILDKKEILNLSKILKNVNIKEKQYKLTFNSSRELLKHIKESGVSGGINKIPISQLRDFIKQEPFKFLNFEVIYFYK